LNIARTTAIKRLHPVSKGSRCSTGRRYDHRWINEAALWITCRKFGLAHLLNTTSFRQFQIVQTKAQTPTWIRSFVFLSIPFNQLPNRLVMFMGGGILKVKCTTLQTRREKLQEMNRWSIVSFEPQKTHLVHPVHLLIALPHLQPKQHGVKAWSCHQRLTGSLPSPNASNKTSLWSILVVLATKTPWKLSSRDRWLPKTFTVIVGSWPLQSEQCGWMSTLVFKACYWDHD
jgi:hypothetical protein